MRQRLAREAVFLLVFGSRPGNKHALQRLGAVHRGRPGGSMIYELEDL